MFSFKKHGKEKNFVGLFKCADASIQKTETFPSRIGSFSDCELQIQDNGVFVELAKENGKLYLKPLDTGKVIVNGAPLNSPVELEDIVALQINDGLYYVVASEEMMERVASIDISKWLVFYAETGKIEDEVAFPRIKNSVFKRGLNGVGLAICPHNFEIGFLFSQVFGTSDSSEAETFIAPNLSESAQAATCPLCWLKFDVGDALSIAVHESLRGDSILGPDEMLRFLPTRFNNGGIAVDPAGMPAPDIACPHCRKKLPPNYLELEQKIFSIVGAPSAGKSYYLSVLIRELQESLYKNFGIIFKDLDPSGNMLLTQMKNRLFSATRPEDAILAKTALEGAMYERYPRFGKMVALPKPMTYSISKDDFEKEASLIFYDNAGEHFEPGLDIEESPGAMHVASSAAIFFIFDPASNRNFKKQLTGYPDPQLTIGGRFDQQDTILSEMEVRIKRMLGLESSKRVSTPMAFIIGKCDIWQHLLPEPLEAVIKDGKLNLSAIDRNSEILKKFLLSLDPSLVAAASSISDNLKFFAVSALGHSPTMILDGECAGKIAPIPEKLNPINVEIPTLWALSETTEFIPVVRD